MDKMFQISFNEGIFVSYQDLLTSAHKLLGCYFYDRDRQTPFILLDKSLKHNTPLHRSIMAEELGHYFTVPQGNFLTPYTSYSRTLKLGRDEVRALRWACDFLMPIENFLSSLKNGINNVHALSETYTVTPWLVYRRMEFIELQQSEAYLR